MWSGFSSLAPERRRQIVRQAFVASLPVLMGYLTMGFAAGVLTAVKGGVAGSPFWAGFIGLACVSGTLSFAIVPALAGEMSLGSLALLTLGINFRYAFYGFGLLERWRGVPWLQKWLLVHTLADEIFALAYACPLADRLENRYYCLWNGLLNVSYWVVGTTLGAAAGSVLPIPSRGAEFAMVALFLVLLTDQLSFMVEARRRRKERGR